MITTRQYKQRLDAFKALVKLTIKECNLSNVQAAQEMGIAYNTLYKMLHGRDTTVYIYLMVREWLIKKGSLGVGELGI